MGTPHISCRWDFATVPIVSRLFVSRELYATLRADASESDIFHAHGLWLMPNVYPAWVAKATGKAFVLSPRGMMAPAALAFSKYKKQVFWNLLQRSAVRNARCLHATSIQEYEEIRMLGLTNPVAIIPNGIEIPTMPGSRPLLRERRVLSLGRIHPKKGLDRLIFAWSRLEKEYPQWKLDIVGRSEINHGAELVELVKRLGARRVAILPPLYNEDKLAAYQNADVFVLSTLNENFGMTVAESLSAGTPVICTKGAPWSGLSVERSGWWIDHGVEPLEEALRQAMGLPPEHLREMGLRGRAWMSRDFSWDRIAADMLSMYRWVLGRGPRPECVVTV